MLTGRVFDQDVQLLIHADLKRAILGVLGLVSVHAAVGLGDKRVGDAAAATATTAATISLSSSHGAVGDVVRQQEHDAAREMEARI